MLTGNTEHTSTRMSIRPTSVSIMATKKTTPKTTPSKANAAAKKPAAKATTKKATASKPAAKAAAKKPTAKKAAVKAPAKKAAAKKAPAKKAASSTTSKTKVATGADVALHEASHVAESVWNAFTTTTTGATPNVSATINGKVIYANDIKPASLRQRFLAWFKN